MQLRTQRMDDERIWVERYKAGGITHSVAHVSAEDEDYIETCCGIRIDVEAVQLLPDGTDDIDCPACIVKAAFTDYFPSLTEN